MSSILLIEDDEALITIIEKRLVEAGYRVATARDASSALSVLRSRVFDIALVDIGLPDHDGFHVAREIKEHYDFPFIFLTAMGSPEYRLEAYELGAADYIPKPFRFRELQIRLEKILGAEKKRQIIRTNDVVLKPESRSLQLSENQPLHLAEREFDLLYHLVKSSPRIISRNEVLADVWHSGEKAHPRAVDNSILKLRRSIGSSISQHIKSVRGAGYQWLETSS